MRGGFLQTAGVRYNSFVSIKLNRKGVLQMQIDITGHQLDITDALRAHVERRLSRMDGRSAMLRKVHVVLHVEHKRHICDIMTRLDGDEFVARADDGDMYAAIDGAADKMERQLQNAKGRKSPRRG